VSENLRAPTPDHFKAAAWKAMQPVVNGEVPMRRLVFEYPSAGGTERIKITIEKVTAGEDPDQTEHAVEDLRSAKTSRTEMSWEPGPKPAKFERRT
jgi:hypothetical protein